MFVEHARMTSTAYFDAFVRHLTSIAISTRRARFPIRFQISSRLTPGYERCRSTLRLPDATESSAHLQQREQTKVRATFAAWRSTPAFGIAVSPDDCSLPCSMIYTPAAASE